MSDCTKCRRWNFCKFDSEEHCRDVIFGGLSEYCLTGEMEKQIVENIKTKGFIRKSELQILIEEAEEIEKLYMFEHNPNELKNIGTLIKTIKALKSEVIKLGGKI